MKVMPEISVVLLALLGWVGLGGMLFFGLKTFAELSVLAADVGDCHREILRRMPEPQTRDENVESGSQEQSEDEITPRQ